MVAARTLVLGIVFVCGHGVIGVVVVVVEERVVPTIHII
jgi:hypothetical protein